MFPSMDISEIQGRRVHSEHQKRTFYCDHIFIPNDVVIVSTIPVHYNANETNNNALVKIGFGDGDSRTCWLPCWLVVLLYSGLFISVA